MASLARQYCSTPQNACPEDSTNGQQSNCFSKQIPLSLQKLEQVNKCLEQPKQRRLSMDGMTITPDTKIKMKPLSNSTCMPKTFQPRPGPGCASQMSLSPAKTPSILNSILAQNKTTQRCPGNQAGVQRTLFSQLPTQPVQQIEDVKQSQHKATRNRHLSPESDSSSRPCSQSSGNSESGQPRPDGQGQYHRGQCPPKPMNIYQQPGTQQYNNGSKGRGRPCSGQPELRSGNNSQNVTPSCSRRQMSCPVMSPNFRCDAQVNHVQTDQQFRSIFPSGDSLNLPPNEPSISPSNMNQTCRGQQNDCNQGNAPFSRFSNRSSLMVCKQNLSGGADSTPPQTTCDNESWNDTQQECCFLSDTENCADGDHRYENEGDFRSGNDYNCECFSDTVDDCCQNDATDDDQCGKGYDDDCTNESNYMYQDFIQQTKDECHCGSQSQKSCNIEYPDNKVQVVIQIPQQLTNRQKDVSNSIQRPITIQNSLNSNQPCGPPSSKQQSHHQTSAPITRPQQSPYKHQGPACGEPQSQFVEPKPQCEEPKPQCEIKPSPCEIQPSHQTTNRQPTPTKLLEPSKSFEQQKSSSFSSKIPSTAGISPVISDTSSNQPPIILVPQPNNECDDLSSVRTYEQDNLSENIKIYYNPNTFNIKTFLESVQTSKLIYYPPPQSFDPPKPSFQSLQTKPESNQCATRPSNFS